MDKVVESILRVLTDHLKSKKKKSTGPKKKSAPAAPMVAVAQVVNVGSSNPADDALNRLKGTKL